MLKRLFKWALWLVVLAVVLAVIFFLSLDSILRLAVEHSIRQQTGMEAEIGKFHFGLTEPVVEIKNLELFNTKQFGGTPFLTIPEIHVEYDRDALRRNEIHITLLRFNLGELDVVKSQDGQTNILSLGLQAPAPNAPTGGGGGLALLKEKTNMEFKGIDCLNVSVGQFKYLDLQDQKNNQAQNIGISNCVITNVTSVADLAGLALVVGLRSGDVFKPLVSPNNLGHGQSAADLLKTLGH
ncbi:MAG: hypothetical protein ABSH48_00930 [Verrucomicrobiota bacterium]|jgi:hypothetical protein